MHLTIQRSPGIVELKNSVLAGESTNPKASREYSPPDDLAGGQEECNGPSSGDVHQLGHSEEGS